VRTIPTLMPIIHGIVRRSMAVGSRLSSSTLAWLRWADLASQRSTLLSTVILAKVVLDGGWYRLTMVA